MSFDTIPRDLRNLRACLLCSLIKSVDQFENDGCENCEQYLMMKHDRDKVYDCTSSNFDGIISLMNPSSSWVAKWQKINRKVKGVYAISVTGTLPSQIINELATVGVRVSLENASGAEIALSQNNNEVHIYSWANEQWHKSHSLLAHDLPVTGIDWAPETNRIVTCSQDKNAFVWTFDGVKWNPDLVLVRLSRAATCVKWSPSEAKFAVGSGSKLVSVCFYEKENNWWISTQIKKSIRSTVNSIDWHPNNVLLAVGSCDFKTRIFSAYVKEVDGDKPGPNPWVAKVPAFGNVVCEFSDGGKNFLYRGWIHCVKFSPSGNRLCWVRHDSSIAVVDATSVEKWESALLVLN
ncbi:unnamed protein product [Soboliphyme baturini]|uniref:Transcription elongation factor SPT4 n=1 Tax=Soboliphyme baturini TaxID=241478 RepID=A0A183IMI2_9BILA|nr:unnamed protein product [Soboliphyme baturini]